MKGIGTICAVIGYIVLGFMQLAAIWAGLTKWLGLHWVIAGPISLFVSYIPIIGTSLGVIGAVSGWGWSWPKALALFFGPFVVIAAIALFSGVIEYWKKRGDNKNE